MRLIAASGWGSQEDRQRAPDAGFDHHLTKPVDPQLLLDGVRQVMVSRPAPRPGERMITLRFEGLQSHHGITVGPAEGFRVGGNFLRRLPENAVLGEYSRHQWHVQGGHFSRYDCIERCQVYFADREGTRSATFGPFDSLYVLDGTMYAGGKLFAKFGDETLLWHSFEMENYWPNLVIASH